MVRLHWALGLIALAAAAPSGAPRVLEPRLRLVGACLALVLLGCESAPEPTSERSAAPRSAEVRLEVGGASVMLPRGATPPDEAQAQRILAPYQLTGGPDDPAVAIRRTPDGALVVLEHTAETLVARGGENVGAFIEDVLDEQLRMGGIAPADPRVTRRRRDGAIQRCFSHVVQGRTRASCTSAYIDEAGTDFVLDMVRCEAERPGAATCARVLDTLASSGAKMGLDRTLEATRSPGLPDVTPDGLAWIRLGATRGELEAACVDAGGRLEAPDMRGAPPALLAAAATGRILACADGGSSSLGRIELVHASFDEEGRVVEAGVWVPADHAELTATLERAYPDYLPAEAMRMNVYFVNRDATGYGLFAISSSPSTVRPGRTILSVKSRRSYDSPPF